MGISLNHARLLIAAGRAGVNYRNTLMIGRQQMRLSTQTTGVLSPLLPPSGTAATTSTLIDDRGYAEPFFHRLGAVLVDSLDVNAYEDATILHDMNDPLPAEMTRQFSAVLDGGSLEHVFNFPQALQNALNLVEVGGHYLAFTPTNNFLGHGFYQFSPELFFRVLTPDNGFALERVILFFKGEQAKLYAVKDPATIPGYHKKVRKTLTSLPREAAYLFVQARKLAHHPRLSRHPQQSNDEQHWQAGRAQHQSKRPFVGRTESPFKALYDELRWQQLL
ncbi:MAG: hypothetical protein ACSLE5_11395 [Porticoccaceae bacterium]